METTKELHIRISFSRRSALLLLAVFFLCWHPGFIGSESLTLTTYYPAPYGGYVSLLTTGGTVGAPVNTLLARNAGNVGIGIAAPTSKMHIAGITQITDGVAPADTAVYGTFGVTRPASAGTMSYIAMTRQGNRVKAMGIDSGNRWVFGEPDNTQNINASQMILDTAGNLGIGAIPPANMRLHVQGDANVTGDLYVGGMVMSVCRGVAYSVGSGSTCNPGERVMTWYGNGAQDCGMLFKGGDFTSAARWSSQMCHGVDRAGTMLCCRFQ